MKFIFGLLKYLVVICAAAFVAIVCVAAAAFMTGTVSAEKIETVRRALNGELVEPSETAPETSKDLADRYELQAIQEAKTALEALKKQDETLTVRINERQNQLALLEAQAARISRATAAELATLQKTKTAFEDERTAYQKQLASAGFKKVVETFGEMRDAQAAAMLYDFDVPVVVELLKAFKKDQRAKVVVALSQIDQARGKTEDEALAPKVLKLIYEGRPQVVTMKTP